MEELQRTLVQVRENTSAIANNMQSMGAQSQSFQQLNQAATDASGAMKGLGEQADNTLTLFERIGKFFNDLPEKIGKTIFGEKGYATFKGVLDNVKMGFDLLTTNVSSMYDAIMGPSAGVFGFIGKIYDELITKASELAQASLDYARALEEVRDKFGSFNETTSRTIKSTAEGLSSSLKEAAGGSGVFGSKFSPGIQGSIERLQAMEGIVSSLGATFNALGEESIKDASAELFVLNKGLNFSAEAMKQTAVLSQLNGTSLKTFSQNIMESVDKIGKRFNISTKVLGQDVGKALSNFKLLGKMTGDYVVQMTKAAAFTRKLGIEIESLTGLVDKFDEFEGGAEAAAQLAQGFGMVLDPIKMMNMQDPAGRLQELQRAFAATGRSFESMTRQERGLLVQTSGLNDEQAALAFSSKGLSMSYDDIQKGADGAMKKQKSTEEVMRDLADNIKNVVVGFQTFAGFIDAFIKGILQGLGISKDFRGIIEELAKGMKTVYYVGLGIGKVLSSVFFSGGIGLAQKWSGMFVNIAKSIEKFIFTFDDASTTLPQKINTLFSEIWNEVSNFANDFWDQITSPASISRMNELGVFIIKGISGALDFAMKNLIPGMTNFFNGLFKPKVGGAKTEESPIVAALKELITVDKLKELGGLIVELMKSIGQMIVRGMNEYPWVSIIGGALTAGGPILATIFGIFGNINNVFTEEGEKIVSGAATALGAGAGATSIASSATTAAAAATMAGAGETTSALTTGLEKLFNLIETPAKITAMAAAVAVSIRILGDALKDVFTSFLEKQPGEKQSFVDLLVTNINKFAGVSFDNFATFGVALAGAGAAIGALVLGTVALATQINENNAAGLLIAGLAIGGLALFGPDLASTAFGRISGAITNMLSGLAEFFTSKDTQNSIIKLARSASIIDALKALSGSILDSFTAMMAITGALPKGWLGGVDIKQLESDAATVKTLFGGEFLKNIAGIAINPVVAAQIKILNASNPFASLSVLLKNVDEAVQASSGAESITFLKNTLIAINDTSFTDSIRSLFTTTVPVLMEGGNVDQFRTAMGQLSGIILPQLKTVVDASASLGGKDKIVELKDALNEIPELMKSMETSITKINETMKNIPALDIPKEGEKFPLFKSIDDYLSAVSTAAIGTTSIALTQFTNDISIISNHLVNVRKLIEDLPDIELSGLIDDIKDNMSIANKTLEIAGGAVVLNVQMNVNMNAMKLSEQLVIEGYLEPTTEFDTYLQYDNGKRQTEEFAPSNAILNKYFSDATKRTRK